jgi:hypothetical protein
MWLAVDDHGRIAAFASRPDNAAHSMDTDWYAVDRGGRVARLWSGEEGAVPWDAHQQYWNDLYEDLAVSHVEQLAAQTPPGRRQVLSLARTIHAIDPASLPYQWNGVLRFASADDLELFRAEYFHAHWRVLDTLAHAVAVKDIQRDAFDDYWRAGAIDAAYLLDKVLAPRAIGLFEYDCPFSGPYQRQAVPAEPLLVDALPPKLKALLGGLRLTRLDFSVTTQIDPQTIARCRTYR